MNLQDEHSFTVCYFSEHGITCLSAVKLNIIWILNLHCHQITP